jgi:hypothetical protein
MLAKFILPSELPSLCIWWNKPKLIPMKPWICFIPSLITQEEMEIEEKRIMQNALTYRLLFPEQAKEDDELFEKTMQKLKDQGIL